jgi:surface protein
LHLDSFPHGCWCEQVARVWQHTDTTTTTVYGGMKRRERFADPMDVLRALPSIIVADIIYPLAVRIIKDRYHLIKAVDFYWDPSNHDSDLCRRYPIGQWDVEAVRDFSNVFDASDRNIKLQNFNEDVSSWNVANGTTFERMFYLCESFNSDVSRWNVANATDLSDMFCNCELFNSDVSRWDVANATDLSYMFCNCGLFNSDLSRWDVANATDLSHMFCECVLFNSDLARWNVANATDLSYMFSWCVLFNSDVSRWNVANATYLSGMFSGCELFNSDLSRWNEANPTAFCFIFDF